MIVNPLHTKEIIMNVTGMTQEKKTIAHFKSAFGLPIYNLGINFENNYGVGIFVIEEPEPDMDAIPFMGMNWGTVAVHVYRGLNGKQTLAVMKAMNYNPTPEELEDDPLFRNVTPDFLIKILNYVQALDKIEN